MTWTYSKNPSLSNKDTVRFLVGDTMEDEPLVTDEEIAWALTQNSNIYAAAAVIAEGISIYLARQADSEELGPITVKFTNRIKAYAAKAKELKSIADTKVNVAPYAGGISVSDKQTNKLDTDRVQSSISIGVTDYLTIADESGL